MTKAIFSRVLCIKNIRNNIRTHTQPALITFFTCTSVFLLLQIFRLLRLVLRRNFMHLVFDLSRIDGFVLVLGPLLLSPAQYLCCWNPHTANLLLLIPFRDLEENWFLVGKKKCLSVFAQSKSLFIVLAITEKCTLSAADKFLLCNQNIASHN